MKTQTEHFSLKQTNIKWWEISSIFALPVFVALCYITYFFGGIKFAAEFAPQAKFIWHLLLTLGCAVIYRFTNTLLLYPFGKIIGNRLVIKNPYDTFLELKQKLSDSENTTQDRANFVGGSFKMASRMLIKHMMLNLLTLPLSFFLLWKIQEITKPIWSTF